MTGWRYVNPDEREEADLDTVPDDVLREALDIAVKYAECPNCGGQQFVNVVPGHNSYHSCKSCGETTVVIG